MPIIKIRNCVDGLNNFEASPTSFSETNKVALIPLLLSVHLEFIFIKSNN
jgi:hypothetical protein